MFLKRNALKAIMTRAYKGGGLRVRNDGAGITICGAKWAVYFLHGDMPKEVMGDLISLVGELPDKHEVYTADKNGNQMEIYDDGWMSPFDIVPNKSLAAVPLTVCGVIGILRDIKSGIIVPIPDGYLQALDYTKLDEDEETPDGPFGDAVMVEGMFINAACWQNNRMAYAVGEMRIENEAVNKWLRALQALPVFGAGETNAEGEAGED